MVYRISLISLRLPHQDLTSLCLLCPLPNLFICSSCRSEDKLTDGGRSSKIAYINRKSADNRNGYFQRLTRLLLISICFVNKNTIDIEYIHYSFMLSLIVITYLYLSKELESYELVVVVVCCITAG